jgi:excisionase family DNA binding protein
MTRTPEGEQTELLTVTEAAQRSGLRRTLISSWISHRKLPAVRIDGRPYVRAEDLAKAQARAHEGDVVPVW